MGRVGATCMAPGSLIRRTVCDGVVSASTVCTNLIFFAIGSDVTKFLTVVASDRFMDVFEYRGSMAVNEDLL